MTSEDLVRIYLTIRDVYEHVRGCEKDFVGAIAVNMPQELREEFERRPSGYVTDFLFYRLTGGPCWLFSHNWEGEQIAIRQMLIAGIGPIDARKIAMSGPFDSETMTQSQKIVVQSLLEGLTLREEKAEEKPAEQKKESVRGDMSVSEVSRVLKISRAAVVANIEAGLLDGYRADPPGSKRPTWRVSHKALEEFRSRRNGKVPEKTPKRKKPSTADVIEFF